MEINSCSDIWSLRHEQQLLIAMNGRPETDGVIDISLTDKNRPSLSPCRLKPHCSLAMLGFAMRFKTAVLNDE